MGRERKGSAAHGRIGRGGLSSEGWGAPSAGRRRSSQPCQPCRPSKAAWRRGAAAYEIIYCVINAGGLRGSASSLWRCARPALPHGGAGRGVGVRGCRGRPFGGGNHRSAQQTANKLPYNLIKCWKINQPFYFFFKFFWLKTDSIFMTHR